ncbi:hypothetical protein JZ751_028390 [Albula glossodonta]|uniref:Uncharacterized protein n=1 Tax=Albula glossodonta TaxID=121402 RepID=A0A8T2NIZ1_9TELE|nr:hypothetical protein JZ751_028390 [Albula glossodonta]
MTGDPAEDLFLSHRAGGKVSTSAVPPVEPHRWVALGGGTRGRAGEVEGEIVGLGVVRTALEASSRAQPTESSEMNEAQARATDQPKRMSTSFTVFDLMADRAS